MKKVLITTLSGLLLLTISISKSYGQYYYFNQYTIPDNYQNYQNPNYLYQYSGPPTEEAMEQLNQIMRQFFSQDFFSQNNFSDEDFNFTMPQQLYKGQLPNSGNSFAPQIPYTEKAPNFQENPDIYY